MIEESRSALMILSCYNSVIFLFARTQANSATIVLVFPCEQASQCHHLAQHREPLGFHTR